jgi:hypothetical protein
MRYASFCARFSATVCLIVSLLVLTCGNASATDIRTTPREIYPGQEIKVRFDGVPSPNPWNWFGLYAPNTPDRLPIHKFYINSCTEIAKSNSLAFGTCYIKFPPTLLPGSYHFRLFLRSGRRVAVSPIFKILETTVNVSTSNGLVPTIAFFGDTVAVSFENVPSPRPKDWIGLFNVSADNAPGNLLDYFSTSSCNKQPGRAPRKESSCTYVLPPNLPEGNYNFRLFADDPAATCLAVSNTLSVLPPGNSPLAPIHSVSQNSVTGCPRGN